MRRYPVWIAVALLCVGSPQGHAPDARWLPIAHAQEAGGAQPGDATGWCERGAALAKRCEWQQALECYERALEPDPASTRALCGRGTMLKKLGRMAEALISFDRALEIDPRSAEAWDGRGCVVANQGDLDEAVRCFDRALELDPRSVRAWVDKANVFHRQGELEAALACVDRALGCAPDDTLAVVLKGMTLSGLEKTDEALVFLDRAIELSRTDTEYWSAAWGAKLAALVNARRFEEAVACADSALEALPREPGLWVLKAVAARALGRPEESLLCVQKALEIEPRNVGALEMKAQFLLDLGRQQDALPVCDEIISLDRARPSGWLLKSSALALMGRWAEAVPVFLGAIDACERRTPGSGTVNEAVAAYLVGGVENAVEVRGYFERALQDEKQSGKSSPRAAFLLEMLALLSASIGDDPAALDYGTRAVGIQETIGQGTVALASALDALGRAHMRRGAFTEALACFTRRLRIVESAKPDSEAVATTLHQAGLCCLLQPDGARGGIPYLERTVALRRRLHPDAPQTALALAALGWALESAGQEEEARPALEEALKLIERVAPDSADHATVLLMLVQRAGAGESLQQTQRALEIVQRQTRGDSLLMGTLHVEVGWCMVRNGDLPGARRHFEQGLSLAERSALGTFCSAWAREGLGTVAVAAGRTDEAIGHYQAAVETIERECYRTGGRDRTWQSSAGAWCCAGLAGQLAISGQAEAAVSAAELLRARSLLGAFAERPVATADAPADLVSRQNALDTRRSAVYAQMKGLTGTLPDEELEERLARELDGLRVEQDALAAEARAASPRYAALNYPEPMPARALCEALEPGTVVLSYFFDREGAWLLCYGPGLVTRAHRVEVPIEKLAESIILCQVAILASGVAPGTTTDDGDAAKQAAAALPSLLQELGRRLVAPVLETLAGAGRVLIVPDGPLWLVPFHALLVDEKTYLADLAPITYTPSATVLVQGRRLRQPSAATRGLLALGDPDFSLPAGEHRGSYMPIRGPSFAAARDAPEGALFRRLPFSGVEVARIGDLLAPTADVRQGKLATEGCVRREGPSHRILHLASHALVDPDYPLDAAVILSRTAGGSTDDDGLLKASEICGLDLRACDLVTLSACETAKGALNVGEGGIESLAYAFLTSGAASVLCTQWSVGDESTAALMLRFYTHYRSGDSKDEALSKAMREIRTGVDASGKLLELPPPFTGWNSAWSQPLHWAPFILVGEYLQTGEAAGP